MPTHKGEHKVLLPLVRQRRQLGGIVQRRQAALGLLDAAQLHVALDGGGSAAGAGNKQCSTTNDQQGCSIEAQLHAALDGGAENTVGPL